MNFRPEAPSSEVNLSNCDREAIHIPGAIQPHGLLLGFELVSLRLAVVSANSAAFFGCAPQTLLGRAMDEIFDAASLHNLAAILPHEMLKSYNPLKLALAPPYEQRLYDGIVHRSDQLVIVELEPAAEPLQTPFSGVYHEVQQTVVKLQSLRQLRPLFQTTAVEIKRLTGFDRVMIYRFDRDWHGEVIAEAVRPDLEPFLGLHYPASDIPAQARHLYSINWLRFIVDVNYQPAPLVAASGAAPTSFDLSHSVLRSVSPMHLIYLRNMGVAASMSVSLMREGKLWGLVACHHYSPKFVPFEVRAASEFIGQIMSWQVATRERGEASEHAELAQRRRSKLVEEASAHVPFTAGLIKHAEDLQQLVGATGVAIAYHDELSVAGITPSTEQLQELIDWLGRGGQSRDFVSDQLPVDYPPAIAFCSEASGLLARSLTPGSADYILWFRTEAVQTVNWAGMPQKAVLAGDAPDRLSPRGSFALWQETVRGRSLPWLDFEAEGAIGLAGAIKGHILQRAKELTALNQELREASRTKDEFVAMVSHELRTPLNAILGWVELLEEGDLEADEWPAALATIHRNARAQQQLIEDLLDISRIVSGKMRLEVRELEARTFVDAAIETVRPALEAKGIHLQTLIDPAAGTVSGDYDRLEQVVWNLLANAIKFTPRFGRVQVRLMRTETNLEVSITDSGEGISAEFLPHVFERFRQADSRASRKYQGLGLGLAIVRHLVELHGGSVAALSPGLGQGATFRVRLPTKPLEKAAADEPRAGELRRGAIVSPPELIDLKVLIVDDDDDARMFIERVLKKCQAISRSAASAAEALTILETWQPDILLSDIGMPEVDGYEFMRTVRQRAAGCGGRVPAIALTSFARSVDRTAALQAGFQTHLSKPIAQAELLAVIASLVRRQV